jgi:prefoldin alpha subunit
MAENNTQSAQPNEAESKKLYNELQYYDSQIKKLQEEFGKVEQQIKDLTELQNNLDTFAEQEPGSESFIPISNGIFVKATIKETDSFLINVGSNVAVPKSKDEAKELIKNQQKELQDYREEILQKVTELDTHAAEIEKKVLGQ